MNRTPRYKQDAVIIMAILVVLIALWRLHSRPRFFSGYGPWAETNIFGASTLTLIPGPAQDGTESQPLPPLAGQGATSGQEGLPQTNRSAASASREPETGNRSPSDSADTTEPLSTNLLHTNGPITVIAAAPSDLVETPPGVASSLNAPEAAALERRLGEVRAKGGDIQISLSWQNYNDLDLHCIDPAGEEIYFSNRKSSRTGGELDVDQNAHTPYKISPVENIYWGVRSAPPGLYRISVVYYAKHSETDQTPFLVRTVVQGKTNFFRSTIRYTSQRERNLICNLSYDPANADPSRRFRFVLR